MEKECGGRVELAVSTFLSPKTLSLQEVEESVKGGKTSRIFKKKKIAVLGRKEESILEKPTKKLHGGGKTRGG